MGQTKRETEQARPGKKIKFAIMIAVLAMVAAYVPVRLLALRFTNQGTKLYNEGKFDEAIVRYERAMKVYPGFKPARGYLCDVCIERADIVTLRNDLAEAERLYKKAIHLNPDANDVHWKLATVYWQQDKRSEALVQIDEHLSRNPNDHRALNLQRVLKGR